MTNIVEPPKKPHPGLTWAWKWSTLEIREDYGDGVMCLPALVANDAVVSMGRVLKSAEAENF